MSNFKTLTAFVLATLVLSVSCSKDDSPEPTSVSGKRMISQESYQLLDLAIPVAFKTEYKYSDNKLVEKKNYFKGSATNYNPAITVEEFLKTKEWIFSYSETFSYYADSLVYNKTKNVASSEFGYTDKNARKEVYYLKNGLAKQAKQYEMEFGNVFSLKSKADFVYENGLLVTLKAENFGNNNDKYEKTVFVYNGANLASVEYYSSDNNTSFSLESKELYKYSGEKISEIENTDEGSASTKQIMVYNGDQLIRIDGSYYMIGSKEWIKNRYSEFKTEGNTLKKDTYWMEGDKFKLYEQAVYTYDDGGNNWDELFKIIAFPQAKLNQVIYGSF